MVLGAVEAVEEMEVEEEVVVGEDLELVVE